MYTCDVCGEYTDERIWTDTEHGHCEMCPTCFEELGTLAAPSKATQRDAWWQGRVEQRKEWFSRTYTK